MQYGPGCAFVHFASRRGQNIIFKGLIDRVGCKFSRGGWWGAGGGVKGKSQSYKHKTGN